MKLEFSSTYFRKILKYHERPPSASLVVPCGQTGRHADTAKLIVGAESDAQNQVVASMEDYVTGPDIRG